MTDQPPDRIVPKTGGYLILAGDFHVHGGPGDGTLLAWELRREAQRAGLDVIAVTNHNTTCAARFAVWWSSYFKGPLPIMTAGEEITSPDYHLVAVGIRETVHRRQSAASAIDAIHRQGGVAIAAHPDRDYSSGYDERALTSLDGAEAADSSNPLDLADYAEFRRRARERNPGIAAIGSSDFHGSPQLGRRRTYLFARSLDEGGVLEAIRSGRTVAADEDGSLYGDAEMVRLVEANRPAGRSDVNAGWRRFTVACAWIGVIGLLSFGPSHRWPRRGARQDQQLDR